MFLPQLTARLLVRAVPRTAHASLLSSQATRHVALAQRLTLGNAAGLKTDAAAKKTTGKTAAARISVNKGEGGKKKPVKRAAKGSTVKKTKKKEEEPKIKIKPGDMPPKHPPNSYILYVKKHYGSLSESERPKNVEDSMAIATGAGKAWKSLSEEEKKPFADEAAKRRVEYIKARDEYYKNVSPELMKEINRRRIKAGKPRIRLHLEGVEKRPMTGFFKFLTQYRKSAEAQEEAAKVTPSGKSPVIAMTKLGAEAWRKMSESEKEVYLRSD